MSDNKSSIDQIVELIQGLVGLILLGGAIYFIFFDTDETEEVKNPTEEYISQLEEKEVNIEKEFIGTYTATDAVGTKLTFILKEDKTVECLEEWKSIYAMANSYSDNNEFGDQKQTETKKHYGSWSVFLGVCEIRIKDGPKVYFSADEGEYGGYYYMKEDFLYLNRDDLRASHPERRLKLKSINN
jgi:hypothetical protein